MYSWGGSMEDWVRPGAYRFAEARAAALNGYAAKAKAAGPRTYHTRHQPDLALTTPKKNIATQSKVPLVIAIDVTGSMQTWPAEIFDRLPLLYQTLSQYEPALEIAFAAIGDGGCDQFPLQVTDFAKGFELEQRLKGLYGEGGGGELPESYGLFAYYMDKHVRVPTLDPKPFLIVFGDAPMHTEVPANQIRGLLGDNVPVVDNALKLWHRVCAKWNVWFLRRPGGEKGDEVDQQWAQAIGEQKILHIHDEARAVDTAMGLIARSWGHFDDFQRNMRARQAEPAVAAVANSLLAAESHLAIPPTRKNA